MTERKIVNFSLRLPKMMHEHLRIINFNTRKSIHEIILGFIEKGLDIDTKERFKGKDPKPPKEF